MSRKSNKQIIDEINKLQKEYNKLLELKIELNADKSLYDFAYFLGYRDLYEPLHRPFCDFIESRDYFYKLAFLPRGHFKTSLGNVSNIIYTLVKNPFEKILIYSSSKEKARDMLMVVKGVFENNERFIRRFGNFVGKRMWTKDALLIAQAEKDWRENTYSIEIGGLDEALTSKHFTYIIFDDIVNRTNSKTFEQRQKAYDTMNEAINSLLNPGGRVLVLGNIYHHDDAYRKIIEKDNVDKGGRFKCYIRQAIEGYKDIDNIWEGKPIFPARYSIQYLKHLEETDEYYFWCNWMNYPKSSKQRIFNFDYYARYEDDEILDKLTDKIAILDPASGKNNQWNDDTAFSIFGIYGNKIYVVDMYSDKIDDNKLCEKIFELMKKYNVKTLYVENASTQEHLINFLKVKKKNYGADDVDVDGSISPNNRIKSQRIIQLKPYLQNKQIVFPKSRIHKTEYYGETDIIQNLLKEEFDFFPFGNRDNLMDTIAYSLDIYDETLGLIELFDEGVVNEYDEKNLQKTLAKNNSMVYNSGDVLEDYDEDIEDIIEI